MLWIGTSPSEKTRQAVQERAAAAARGDVEPGTIERGSSVIASRTLLATLPLLLFVRS
jgi:hypothetical protein